MKPWMLIALGALAASTAYAQPPPGAPATTIMCFDTMGRILPSTCHAPGSRLEGREFICLCNNEGRAVEVPVCPTGVKPPHENTQLERARAQAMQKGTLVGMTYKGGPMCVQPRIGQGGASQ